VSVCGYVPTLWMGYSAQCHFRFGSRNTNMNLWQNLWCQLARRLSPITSPLFNYLTTIAQRACNAVRVVNRLPYNQSSWCQLDRNCDQATSTTTIVVDVTAYYSASAPSWTRTTMADGHKRFKQQKWPSMSLKVTLIGAVRQATYDFLLVFNCNYVFISHHF